MGVAVAFALVGCGKPRTAKVFSLRLFICPNYHIMKKSHKIAIGSITGLSLLVCMIPDEPKTSEEILKEARFSAFAYSEEIAKSKLASPASADFAPCREERIFYTNDSIFTINSYVNAENIFGGNVRSEYVCNAKYLGGDPDSTKNWELKAFFFK